ncbi:MAG TPA: phage holin family protein [Burkholderiales bacterium]|nr:phage holin family protein [Burkholderiales bacterium]
MANPVRTLLGSATGLAQTRLALLGTEVREELARFAATLLGGCAAIACAALALGAGAAGLIMAAGEYRLLASFGVAALFATLAVFICLRVRAASAARPVAFAATLDELERDCQALVERSHDERGALGIAGGELMRLVSIGLLAYSVGKGLRRAA